MEEHPRQIVISAPLWGFMQHCEVYCTAACCGIDAFELHPALLLRKVIDENLTGQNGHRLFRVAWKQLQDLIYLVDHTELKALHDSVPFWNDEPGDLPQYWLPKDQILKWLSDWNNAFNEASRYGGLEKD